MALLEVRGVSFRVDGKTILDGLDLAIAEREIHALIGTNGTGKSTLAFVIMGCEGYAPTSGEIAFAGRVINGLPLHERARLGITLAWQEPARFEGISVKDYVALGDARIDPRQYLRRVGLAPEAYLDRLADRTLSGGERKRLELAAVLAREPRLAILDEPASGIDLLSIHGIVDVIHAFKEHAGSVLLITHQEEVARIADVASLLCGGRIVATGGPDEVIARYTGRRCTRCDGTECIHGRAA
jgi:Fe-S cluster assembly ATP-binding protein